MYTAYWWAIAAFDQRQLPILLIPSSLSILSKNHVKRLSQKLTVLWSTSIVKRFVKIIFTKPYGKHKDALKNKRF